MYVTAERLSGSYLLVKFFQLFEVHSLTDAIRVFVRPLGLQDDLSSFLYLDVLISLAVACVEVHL